ncbi:elongation factor 1-gamma [Podospora aff. communis PSN243]|uniref:Elongation factor 1-gamma n=1 Tax=Podospora aff. communis PSN243 TaxID=3040156 RepID=A0AAV9H4K9_9PEZI|nr:elongation factor 1-gamma [Podospora aff. communis PSN243]
MTTPFATIYSYPDNFRVKRAKATSLLSNLTLLESPSYTHNTTNRTPEFLSKFPLGKVPALETSTGFTLTEGFSICRFLADSGSRAAQLLGGDVETRARIDEWCVFAEMEVVGNVMPVLGMLVLKVTPWNEWRYGFCVGNLERALGVLEGVLSKGGEGGNKRFLVGEEITLADVMVGGALVRAGNFLMDKEMRRGVPAVEGYLRGLMEVPEMKEAFGELVLVEERVRVPESE